MPTPDDYVTVKRHKVFATTEKAILVANQSRQKSHPNFSTRSTWIPRQFLGPGNQLNATGDTGNLIIPRWVADQNDMIVEPD